MKSWKTSIVLIFLTSQLMGQVSWQRLGALHQASLAPNLTEQQWLAKADSLWLGLQENLELGLPLPTDSLPSISQVGLKGKHTSLYTWLTRSASGFHSWGLMYDHKQKSVLALERSEAITLWDFNLAKKVLSGGKWPAMLVYEAVPFKRKGQLHFLLLGFNPGEENIHFKHVEVLSFDRSGLPQFGSRLILWEGAKIGRKTFRYSAQASMMLKLEKEGNRIVMDHLAPASPELKSQFAFYGPDLSYDALEFNGEEWVLIPNVDLKNPSQDLGKPGQIQRFGPNIKSKRQD